MKAMTLTPVSKVSTVDITLCLCAIALGGAIVLYNQAAPVETQPGGMASYMERIVSRMDVVGAQLADWYAQDIR